MKKFFLFSAFLFIITVIFSSEAKAQWTNPYGNYRMNDLIRRTPKKSAAKTSAVKSGKSTMVRKKKVVRRAVKKRRAAIKENTILPETYRFAAIRERNYTASAL